MTTIHAKVLLALLVLASRSAFAQGTSDRYLDPVSGLSVEDAVRQALEREPTFQAARGEIDVARGQQTQASLRANPSVTVEYRGEPSGSDNLTMAQVQWPLELFRRSARVNVAERQLDVVQQTVDDRARSLAADVRMRYGDAAAAIRRVMLAERAHDTLARQVALVSARVGEGAAPPLERDQVEVEARRAEVDALLASGDADAAMLALKRALGLLPDATIRLRDSLETLADMTAPPVDDSITSRRSDVMAAEAEIHLAEARLTEAEASGRFDLGMYASYMRMDSTFPQLGLNSVGVPEPVHGVFHYVSLGATVMLPWGNKNQGTIAAARAEQAVRAGQLQAVKISAAEELAAAQSRVRQSARAVDVSAAAVALADKNRGIVEQTYALGRATLNDVLAEERRYVDAEKAHAMVLKASYDAMVALRSARGDR